MPPSGRDRKRRQGDLKFERVSRDGEVLETFVTAEQRWQAGDTVIAHGNRWYRVLSVIPVERIAEFVDEPSAGMLEVEPLR